MKKILVMILPVMIIFLSGGCTQSEFINLDTFIERFNSKTVLDEISFFDFYVLTQNSDEQVYNCSFKSGEDEVLLRIFENADGKIMQCRVILPKCDENGKSINISTSGNELLKNVCTQTITAFSNLSYEEADKIAQEILNNDEKSEVIKDEGSFHYVVLEDTLCKKLMIQNKWLSEIETTLKPESKTAFGQETSIRTETVPLR